MKAAHVGVTKEEAAELREEGLPAGVYHYAAELRGPADVAEGGHVVGVHEGGDVHAEGDGGF